MSQAPSALELAAWFVGALLVTFALIGLLELRDRRREARALPIIDRSICPTERGHADNITQAQGLAWADALVAMNETAAMIRAAAAPAPPQEPAPIQRPLPPIRRSPLVSPIPPGWGRPAPQMPRPVGPEPGTRTQELMRILEEDTLATAVIR